MQAVVERAQLEPKDVEECFMGNVVSANSGQAPAKQAALFGGLPDSVPCTAVNKVCASGMKSLMFGALSIMSGYRNTIIAGGFESMSNVPYYLPKGRDGYRLGHGEVLDGIVKDGLWDVYNDAHMGYAAEKCAEKYNFSREQQDEFALLSYDRSLTAIKQGEFNDELIPVEIKSKKGSVFVREDEEPGRLQRDRVKSMKPAFLKDGTVTVVNASSINDGGCALLVMNEELAAKRGMKPLARIIGFADAARAPLEFTTAPALSVPPALKMAGISVGDVDFWEINEAFSVVVLANAKELGLDINRVNVNGGAVSLGHPIGCSGARIVTTLVHKLIRSSKKYGCASICNGGGGASAIVVENICVQ